MDNSTFRSRLVELIQKSRKAMRLYSSVGRGYSMPGEGRLSGGEYAEIQAEEWRNVNAELVRKLTGYVESPQQSQLAPQVVAFFQHIYEEFRRHEAELNSRQRDLIFASENGDFVKAALLSRQLVALKAKVQASQAAQHELEMVLRRSKIEIPRIAHTGALISAGEYDSEHITGLTNQYDEYQEQDQQIEVATAATGTDSSSGDVRLAKVIPLRKVVK